MSNDRRKSQTPRELTELRTQLRNVRRTFWYAPLISMLVVGATAVVVVALETPSAVSRASTIMLLVGVVAVLVTARRLSMVDRQLTNALHATVTLEHLLREAKQTAAVPTISLVATAVDETLEVRDARHAAARELAMLTVAAN